MQMCDWRIGAAVMFSCASIAQAGVIESDSQTLVMLGAEGQEAQADSPSGAVNQVFTLEEVTYLTDEPFHWTMDVRNSEPGIGENTQFLVTLPLISNDTGHNWTGFEVRLIDPIDGLEFSPEVVDLGFGVIPFYYIGGAPDIHTPHRLAWTAVETTSASAHTQFLLDVPNITAPGETGYDFMLAFTPLVPEPTAALLLLPAMGAIARRPRRAVTRI